MPGRTGALAQFSLVHHVLGDGAVDRAALDRAVAALLAVADRARRRGRPADAGGMLDLALQLSYHPSVHFSERLSPLATDPDSFLAAYEASPFARELIASPDALVSGAAHRQPEGRARRVLILAHDSWTFIDRVRADLASHADVEFRSLRVGDLPAADRPSHRSIVGMRVGYSLDGRLAPVPAALVPHLEWADAVMVEWGTYPLAWFSLLDTERFGIEVVARLHRFEAYTPYPMLTRFARIGTMAFVSDAVRALVARQAPRLPQAGLVVVVRNVHSYEGFAPAKDEDAPWTLVQVGWAPPVKDVLFSLRVLRRLREEDDRYRLLLLGAGLPEHPAPHEASWVAAVREALQQSPDGVEILGYRDDVPAILSRAGFLLSSSLHEGTHESVAEAGMAGCVPVVRDWPEAAPYGGAEVIYPADWVVPDVDAAAARVLAHQDLAMLTSAGARAREWVQENRDADDVRLEYLDLLGLHPRG
ncbi:glycosyltransferase [Brachybacterium hainanense]|uniref:Glycosyltransferase n=1 Tax=Brachybacterium hainanense TaxID=1541174 RepID=A0ABV6RDG2_9MICO